MTDSSTARKNAYDTLWKKLLTLCGYTEEAAEAAASAAYALEEALAPSCNALSVRYREDYNSLVYNPYDREGLEALSPALPLTAMLEALGAEDLSCVVVMEPEAIRGINALFTDEHLEELKAYCIVHILTSLAPYASMEARNAYLDCTNTISGSTGRKPDNELAVDGVTNLAGELMGLAYAGTYFDAETRQDVENIIAETIEAYAVRLEACDWLSEQTRETAVGKLRAITVRVGYPDVTAYA